MERRGGGVTQVFEMRHAAPTQHSEAAMNGHVRVPERSTSASPATPDTMAAMQLSVVMFPKTELSSSPRICKHLSWYSEIIHASNTLKRRVVPTPPQSLPRKRTQRLSLSIVAQVTTYSAQ